MKIIILMINLFLVHHIISKLRYFQVRKGVFLYHANPSLIILIIYDYKSTYYAREGVGWGGGGGGRKNYYTSRLLSFHLK